MNAPKIFGIIFLIIAIILIILTSISFAFQITSPNGLRPNLILQAGLAIMFLVIGIKYLMSKETNKK